MATKTLLSSTTERMNYAIFCLVLHRPAYRDVRPCVQRRPLSSPSSYTVPMKHALLWTSWLMCIVRARGSPCLLCILRASSSVWVMNYTQPHNRLHAFPRMPWLGSRGERVMATHTHTHTHTHKVSLSLALALSLSLSLAPSWIPLTLSSLEVFPSVCLSLRVYFCLCFIVSRWMIMRSRAYSVVYQMPTLRDILSGKKLIVWNKKNQCHSR